MNTYPRSEKLKSEKEISYLFQRGKWVYRLHKQEFIDVFGENVLAMVFWVSPKLPQNYFEVERHFMKLLFIKNKN